MVNKLANVSGGEIFAIQLFLSDRSELERFKKSDFLGEDNNSPIAGSLRILEAVVYS